MAAVLELRAIADGSDRRRRGLGTDAFDLRDPLAGFVFAEHLVDLLVEGSDPSIEIAKQVVKFGDRLPRHRRQFVALVGRYVGDHPTRSGNALGEGKTAIQQQAQIWLTTAVRWLTERDGELRERIRYLCRASLLVVDEIGYLPVTPGGANLFFNSSTPATKRAP